MNLSSRPSIAVIILNYNGQHWLSAFLAGVVEHSHEWASVWVADNGSTDASFQVVEKQGQAKWLDLGKNHGFALGYNLAIERIEADYVVLLNSDVEIRSSWLPPLVDFMESNADYAACQPKIKAQRQPSHFEYAGASGGYIDAVGFPYCRGRVFYTTEEDLGQYDSPADIHWASGCCLFIRRTAYLDAGGLDADLLGDGAGSGASAPLRRGAVGAHPPGPLGCPAAAPCGWSSRLRPRLPLHGHPR
jgi:GT2 family glycosyltransferase